MKRTTNETIAQIRELLNELEEAYEMAAPLQGKVIKGAPKEKKGCMGIIERLVTDGFFETQHTVAQVVDRLEEEGQPYSKELVSMNLLSLVKSPRRILRRIKKDNNWQYILRK